MSEGDLLMKQSKQIDTLFKALCSIHYSIGKSVQDLQQIAYDAMEAISPDPFKPDVVREEEAA